jgi:hypothetical protein
MLKTTSEIAIRLALVVSIASAGTLPAAAVPLPITLDATGQKQDDRDPLSLRPLLAALDGIGGRQTVSRPDREPTRNVTPTTDNDGRNTVSIGLSAMTTRKIVRDLESVRRECTDYDQVYRIDCLRQGIDMIVATLPDNSEYREAKNILRRTSARLSRVVATYQDPSAPRLEAAPNANPRFRKRRAYAAIRRDAVPDAMARAQKIIDEAKTELLRSGENSERRYAHYQDISFALDSTKVLLRSS